MHEATWDDVVKQLDQMLALRVKAWSMYTPGAGSRPDRNTERACDDYVRRMLLSPDPELDPPDNVKAWILVRLLCALELARLCAKSSPQPPVGNMKTAIWRLLVDEWKQNGPTWWSVMVEREPWFFRP